VSKALLNAATRALAVELGPRLRVNAVCPGWVRTDLGGPRATRSVRDGAASIVATALAPRVTGGFFRDGAAIRW
jgi:NAD(P)-dependent dehydrogenase (short-subunit alcohol dehydrogenase family)